MKVRKKALAVLLCAFVVCLMVFGTLSAASAAAVPTGTVTAEDTSSPAVPGLDSIPIVGPLVGGLVDTLTGGSNASIPAATSEASIPGLDSLIPTGGSNPLQPLLNLIPSGGSNPLQPLLDLLNPSNIPGLDSLTGGGDSSGGLISILSPILSPLHDGLELLRDPLTTGLAPLYEALKPIEGPLTQALAPVKDIVEDVVTTLDPVLYPVLHALSPVLCPVLGVLEPVIAELAKVCPNILPPCEEPTEPAGEEETPVTPVTPVTPSGGGVTTGSGGSVGGVLPFTGANLTAMIVLLMALVGVVVALRRAHLVLKARER